MKSILKTKDTENTIIMANVQLATQVRDVLNMLRTMQDNITTFQADMGRRFDTLRDHVDRRLDALTTANNQSNQRLNTIEQNLTTASTQSNQRLTTIAQNLTTATGQSNDRLTTIGQNLTTANDRLTDANNRLTTIGQNLTTTNDRLTDANNRLTDANTNLGQLTTTSNDSNGRLVTIQEDLGTAIDGLNAANDDLGQLTAASNQSNNRLITIEQDLTTPNNQQGRTTLRGRADTLFIETQELTKDRVTSRVSISVIILPINVCQRPLIFLLSHFNCAARIINANAGRCNMAISAFHGIDNQRIPDFPTTYAHLEHLDSRSTLNPKYAVHALLR
jgi:chromosome segregation ATPase